MNCGGSFLGLIPWYHYVLNSSCQVSLDLTQAGQWNGIWLIGLAVIDDLIRIAGIAAVVFVIYGGIRYVTSQGEPENIKNAQSTILNALVGLVIAVVAVTLVNYLGEQFSSSGTSSGTGLPNVAAGGSLISNISFITFGIIGAISLLMIVIGGFKYITSRGEPAQIASAKNTIIFAIVGLVISLFAVAIVNLVITKIA